MVVPFCTLRCRPWLIIIVPPAGRLTLCPWLMTHLLVTFCPWLAHLLVTLCPWLMTRLLVTLCPWLAHVLVTLCPWLAHLLATLCPWLMTHLLFTLCSCLAHLLVTLCYCLAHLLVTLCSCLAHLLVTLCSTCLVPPISTHSWYLSDTHPCPPPFPSLLPLLLLSLQYSAPAPATTAARSPWCTLPARTPTALTSACCRTCAQVTTVSDVYCQPATACLLLPLPPHSGPTPTCWPATACLLLPLPPHSGPTSILLACYCPCPPDIQVTTGSDVYSFGVLMWSLYTGQHPYVTTAGQFRPNTLFPHFPRTAYPQYKSLAERCLQGDPRQRPSFAEAYPILASFFDQELDASACENDGAVLHTPSAPKPCLQVRPAAACSPDLGTAGASGVLTMSLRSGGDEGPMLMVSLSGCENRPIGYCTSRGLLASCLLDPGPQGC